MTVSLDEAKLFCPRLPEVETYANEASRAFPSGAYKSMAVRGSDMHFYIKNRVNGSGDTPKNPSFIAETSLWKTKTATLGKPAPYGARGTIRIDVLEERDKTTVCFYDMKTGLSFLSAERQKEIFQTAAKWYPKATNLIVLEVKVE